MGEVSHDPQSVLERGIPPGKITETKGSSLCVQGGHRHKKAGFENEFCFKGGCGLKKVEWGDKDVKVFVLALV